MRDPDKPQAIIDAAIRVFARNGYYNSRVSDIAREAGIASGTIYLYFKTKDDILVRVIQENPDLAEVVQVELRQGHKFFRGASAHEVSAYFDVIQSVLEEGVAAGRVRRDLALKIATKMLFGAMDQLATSWVLGKRAYRLTDAAEPVASIFLKGVTTDGV